MQRDECHGSWNRSHTSLTTYFKLFFRGHRLSGSVIDGHGVSGQPMLFLQLSVEQVQGWGEEEKREIGCVNRRGYGEWNR